MLAANDKVYKCHQMTAVGTITREERRQRREAAREGILPDEPYSSTRTSHCC